MSTRVTSIGRLLRSVIARVAGRKRSEAEDARRGYGDSIADARTSVDPAVGMRPVNSEPPRR